MPIGMISVRAPSRGRSTTRNCRCCGDLRRPGRGRHPERAAVQPHEGSAGAADRHRRDPGRDRRLARGRAAGARQIVSLALHWVGASAASVFHHHEGRLKLLALAGNVSAEARARAIGRREHPPLGAVIGGARFRRRRRFRVLDGMVHPERLLRDGHRRGTINRAWDAPAALRANFAGTADRRSTGLFNETKEALRRRPPRDPRVISESPGLPMIDPQVTRLL